MINDPHVEDFEELAISSAVIVKSEERTRRRVTLLTIIGVLVITIGSGLFALVANQLRIEAEHARNDALSQLDLAETARNQAEKQRDVAETLTKRLDRSSAAQAISPNRQRSISKAGWLLDQSGKPIAEIAAGDAGAAIFTPDSRLVFVPNASGREASLFDAGTGLIVASLNVDIGVTTFAAFSPDARSLLIASDRGVFIYDIPEGRIGRLATMISSPVVFAAFSPSSSTLVLGTDHGQLLVSHDRGMHFLLLQTDSLRDPVRASVRGIAFSRDGQTILAVYSNGEALVIELASGKTVANFDGFVYAPRN